MSSSRLKPSLTPLTLFATSARIRPWNARVFPSSSLRSNFTTLSFTSTEMPVTIGVDRLPFGPFTTTLLPSWRTSTPFGSAISFLPMRDIGLSLPNLAEHFAAHARLRGLIAGEHALRGGDDRQSEAAENLGDLFLAAIDALSGTGDALDAVDDRLAVSRVLQVDAERGLRLAVFFDDFLVADETLRLEDAGGLAFSLRGRHLDAIVPRRNSVAEAGEHIRDWICHRHSCDSSYQLDFVTPGM